MSISKHFKSFSFKTSNSTLWQTLKSLKPGPQQAMTDLDNVTTDGLLDFEVTENKTANILDD